MKECQAITAICYYSKRHADLTGYWVCEQHNKVTNHQVDERSHKPCVAVDSKPCKPCGKMLGVPTSLSNRSEEEW